MLLANHPKANELAKTLLGFKDLFLVGFFLSVGMTALPGWTELIVAVFLLLILPIKVALYFGLFAVFRLRGRTAWQSSLNLANYSEFGLIVGTMASAAGWLPPQWLAVLAIALSVSFVVSAPLATAGDRLYARWRTQIKRCEHGERLALDAEIPVPPVNVIIFGMGRVGASIYDAMAYTCEKSVLGVDSDETRADQHRREGRHVVDGDGTNPDFWSRVPGLAQQLEWVILALPSHHANLSAAERLREQGFAGRIAAATRYPEQTESLEALGVEFAFDIHREVGRGFVEDLRPRL
jgi:hypothetical protein